MVPLLEIPRYALDRQATKPESIATWLDDFFAGLLTPTLHGSTELPVLVGLQSSYTYSLVPGGGSSGVPATIIPVSLLPPTSTEGQLHPAFITQVGDADQQWFETERPGSDSA